MLSGRAGGRRERIAQHLGQQACGMLRNDAAGGATGQGGTSVGPCQWWLFRVSGEVGAKA